MLYAAYTLNMNVIRMLNRCPDAKLFGNGWLNGYALAFRGKYGHGTLEETADGSGAVPCVLWNISSADERALDRLAGIPGYYRKARVKALCNGKIQPCMTYVMNGGARSYPSYEDFDCIRRGYEYAGFDPAPLYDALRDVDPKRFGRVSKLVNEYFGIGG